MTEEQLDNLPKEIDAMIKLGESKPYLNETVRGKITYESIKKAI